MKRKADLPIRNLLQGIETIYDVEKALARAQTKEERDAIVEHWSMSMLKVNKVKMFK